MAIQLGHKGLAETHDLSIAAAAGIKVAAALGAADGQAGQSVLEGLLKAQELDDGQVDGGVEAQTALVGAQGGIVLHTIAAVHMILAVVVHPGDAELNGALRLHDPLQQAGLFVLGVSIDHRLQRREDLFHSLQEFGLGSVLFLGGFQHTFNVCVHFLFLLKAFLSALSFQTP